MIKHSGGNTVGKGTYWNISNGERVDVTDSTVLPGNRTTTYYRLPAAAILLMGPVLGLLYAAFLPFIGIAMAVKLVLQKVGGEVLVPVGGTASFGWRPSESYLAGRKKREKKPEKSGDGS